MNKTTKRSRTTSKKSTAKVKRTLPKNISKTTAGNYRVRKMIKGVAIAKTVSSLSAATKALKTITG